MDKSGTLDKLEFEEMISKLGIFMTTQELTAVYNQFDHNRDGRINYDEFVSTIRVSSWYLVLRQINQHVCSLT